MITLATVGDLWLLACIIAVAIGFVAIGISVERARKKSIFAHLRSGGFEVEDRARAFDERQDGMIAGNPLLLYKRCKVRWRAMGSYGASVVRLVEYAFVTGYGKSQQTHAFLLAATDMPTDLPEFTIERKRLLMSHRPKLKAQPPPVGDQRIAESFACYATDSSGAATLLTPAVCEELATWDKKWFLRYSSGVLTVGKRGRHKVQDVEAVMQSLDRMVAAVLAGVGSSPAHLESGSLSRSPER